MKGSSSAAEKPSSRFPYRGPDGDLAQRGDQRRRDVGLAHDLSRDPEIDGAFDRLPSVAHPRVVQREGVDVQDGLVTQIEGPESEPSVLSQSVVADEHDHGSHSDVVGAGHELSKALGDLVSEPDGVTRAEGDTEQRSIGQGRAPIRRERVLLVLADCERVEGVAIAQRTVDEPSHEVPVGLLAPRWDEDGRRYVAQIVGCPTPSVDCRKTEHHILRHL